MMTTDKKLFLGSALWGWGIQKHEVFQLLDEFIAGGGRDIDCATNYPINGESEKFGLTLNWLAEWLQHQNEEINVLVKVGSINNLGGKEVDLTPESLKIQFEQFKTQLGQSFKTFSVHWDPRSNDYDRSQIKDTLSFFESVARSGYHVGFSGVMRPDIYAEESPTLQHSWRIQVKENILTAEARILYQKYFPNARYLAYGINMGGVKREEPCAGSSVLMRNVKYPFDLKKNISRFIDLEKSISPHPSDFNEVALYLAYTNPNTHDIIIGPRVADQLQKSMAFWKRLRAEKSLTDYNTIRYKILRS